MKIKAPVILPKRNNVSYHAPCLSWESDSIMLNAIKKEVRDGETHYKQIQCTSKDLRTWSQVIELETVRALPAEKAVSILDAKEQLGFFLRVQEGEGKEAGSIVIAISSNQKHWITFERDQATYPDNGVYYEGDYYRAIPFGEYIYKEEIPVGPVFDIREYGAVADERILSTPAFHAAVEAAKEAGGGTILVTGGHYCVGTVYLYDNMTLFIDTDAALVASKNLDNFKDAFIACKDAENVRICGGGKIMGNGEYFVHLPLKKPLLEPLPYTKLPPTLYDPMGYPVDSLRYAYRARIRYAEDRYNDGLPHIQRPMYTLWVRGCNNVEVENIIIEDSLDWTLDIDYSTNVLVKDIVINGNRHVANTDGIDIMCSRNVTVEHCFISCADDGLCIKAPRKQGHDGINIEEEEAPMGPSKDIHISDCTVISVMNAFKIGTETYFDIENVTVENCKFMMPDIFPGGVSGISIESADGSHVKNITLRNIEMEQICCPIYIGLNMRNKFGFVDENDKAARYYGGAIEGVLIENVTAYDVEVPSILTGFEIEENGTVTERCIKDIKIKNVHAVYRDNEERLNLTDKVQENIVDYPENNAIGDVPAYGFYVRHAENVSLEAIDIVPRTHNTRVCIYREE